MVNPGMWQYYISRPENNGLSVETIRRRFLAETIRYEEYLAESMLQNSIADNNNGAGGGNAFIEVSTTTSAVSYLTTENNNQLITENDDNIILD